MYNRISGTSFSLIRQSLWASARRSLRTVVSQLMTIEELAGLEWRLAAAREGLKHLPAPNKQFTVEPDHAEILWQIHQLAADVICILDNSSLSMSGKQSNLVSNGRSGFQLAFQELPGICCRSADVFRFFLVWR